MRLTRLLTPLFALALALPAAGCGSDDDDDVTGPTATATVETTTFAPSLGVDLAAPGWTRTSTGLYYRTLAAPAGTSPGAVSGQSVSVDYTGWLSTGREFDSGNYPFILGTGNAIAGWHQGIVGMRVGERRRLLIPPSLAYGRQGSPPEIPGNAVLVFDVELRSAQ